MAEVIVEWAGKERLFRLTFGSVLELEEACDSEGICAIYTRMMAGQWRLNDVWHTIRLGLIGGGENKIEAKRLLETFFDRYPYMENAALAGDIIMAIMTGVEDSKDVEVKGDVQVAGAIKFSEVSQICRVFNVSPLDLREMPYSDVVNMIRGFDDGTGRKAAPPSEEEFEEILAKYEPEALRNG